MLPIDMGFPIIDRQFLSGMKHSNVDDRAKFQYSDYVEQTANLQNIQVDISKEVALTYVNDHRL
jgi:hypothetical protein